MGGRIAEDLDGVLKLLPVSATKYVNVLAKGADTGSCSCMGQVWNFLPGEIVNVVAVVALKCDEVDELVSVVGETRVSLSGATQFLSFPPYPKQFSLVVQTQNSVPFLLVFELKQLVTTNLARNVSKVSKI